MNYLLYGKQRVLIDDEIKKIISENNVNDLNISKYNLEDDELKNIIDDALMFSMFGDKKLIIVDDAFIFSTIKRKKEIDTKELEKYLDNSPKETIIIFISNDENINNVKKIVKSIKKNGKVQEFNKEIDKESYIKRELKDYKISDSNIKLFADRINNDLGIINNEINKLKLYKENDKEITKDDIISVISKTYEIDIFKFIDNIIYGNIEKSLEMYYEMLKNNEEPIKIISILADNFRLMYQSKELSRVGYNIFDIGNMLEQNPYRIKFILEKGNGYTNKKLLSLIDTLADLDLKIKTGKIDKNLALELFIINQKRN